MINSLPQTFLLVAFIIVVAPQGSAEVVDLEHVSRLTFRRDQLTTGHRTGRRQQIECLSGPCEDVNPEKVHCTRVKGDPITWKCTVPEQPDMILLDAEVNCERDGTKENSALKGSCSLRFNTPSSSTINWPGMVLSLIAMLLVWKSSNAAAR